MPSDAVPSPAPAFRRRWDVFLSFRGEDTRKEFTDRLYTRLQQKGVRAFRDNEGLNRGDTIASSLLDAIEDSAAFIAIISPNYADSRWCLEELAKVCECDRLILPVFYKVDPSHVRRQGGPFRPHFEDLEARFGKEETLKWRKAMAKAGGIAGSVVNGLVDEAAAIQTLVNRVLAELSKWSGVAAFTVGLDSRVEEGLKLLDLKSNSTRVLGLHGPGGVGKSTLAKALYNKLVAHFETRSFIPNVKKVLAQENGLLSLQTKLIGDLSGGGSSVNDVNAGLVAIRSIVREKPVLIILDDVDVDDASQLTALAGRRKWRAWFHEGSRIILTTRDRDVLCELHENELYEVKQLDSSQSLQLFSHHASGKVKPTPEFLPLSQQIVSLTGGLPLALEVFGSSLFDKRKIEEWEDAVLKLKQIRPRDLQGVLKISYDGLDEEQKCIFLDIACLFIKMGMGKEEAIDILRGCGFRADIGIRVLVDKSLLKIAADYTLWMHDQLRDMGRQIVLQEHHQDIGMRSRLWDRSEILSVLHNDLGSRSIQGMVLDFASDIYMKESAAAWYRFRGTPNFTTAVTWLKKTYKEYRQQVAETERGRELILQTKSFQSMINLRLLQIDNLRLEGKFELMPAELKWLRWRGCTLKTLPSDFCPQGLRMLDLSESKHIERLWSCRSWWSWYNNKVGKNLMVINLRHCCNLTDLPDLSGNQALEKLILERCTGLVKIHKSIGDVVSLLHLDMSGCNNLVEFPSDVSGLKNLETLILSGCSKLTALPENMSYMKSLRELFLDETLIEKLPESLIRLPRLERLSLNRCQSLKHLPERIGNLKSLTQLSFNDSAIEKIPDGIGSLLNLGRLSLMRCESLNKIPDSIRGLRLLTEFSANGTPIRELPASIGSLSNLKDLSLGYCKVLRKLPASIEGLASMVVLQLDGTPIKELPDQIDGLKTLQKLKMRSCKSLESLPEAIGRLGSLDTLIITNASITELPESIGMLENLVTLNVNKCKQLCRLPDSVGNLKSLHRLRMEETAVRRLPESFGMLSSLMSLLMAKRPHLQQPQSTVDAEDPENSDSELVVLPASFSNLSLLYELDARSWKISGKIPDDFKMLSSLETLNLGGNNFSNLPCSLRGLSVLRKLILSHCEELKALPPLPSSLIEVNAGNCYALEVISTVSNLESLQELNLTNCKNLVDVPGVESLKSLKGLFMRGCSSCAYVVRRRLTKTALKNMRTLSFPGSDIPDWFSENVAIFSQRKNLALKAVIIAVVVSVSQYVQDGLSDQPSIPGIHAKMVRMNRLIFSSTLDLMGVPDTNEDHLYLRRYHEFHPLVSKLRDEDQIQVTTWDLPKVKGVELKKSGVYLVFENDDDFDEDEGLLDENWKTVSEKLARFFASSGGEVVTTTLDS